MSKKLYCCEFCNKIFKGRSAKVNRVKHILHCSMNPESKSYFCKKCNKEFNKRHSFIGHQAWCGKIVIKTEKVKKTEKPKTEKNTYKCKYCDILIYSSASLGGHMSSCKLNPNYQKIRTRRIEANKIPRIHTQETKDRISKARKEYLKNNPDRVPYLLNHSSEESYPEKYFSEIFEKENINVIKKFRIGLYELDFCILNKKIDIEIDGSQHYLDKKIILSDKRRTDFLESNGWRVVRIEWSKYQKLSKDEKIKFVKDLKSYIDNMSIKPEMQNYIFNSVGKDNCNCGKEKYKKSTMCRECRALQRRKVKRPSLEQIMFDVENLGYRGSGKKYNVSDSCIKKWINNYKNKKEQDKEV